MTFSGWEIVDQEKCKLTYAKFFDGVQCYDVAKNMLQLATPDFEYNQYDPVTKTLSTKSFSVRPVVPTDLKHIQRPVIWATVDMIYTGLEVTLTADEYTKKRIIPMYYLDTCNSYSWSDLSICIDAYQEELVTVVSYDVGELSFITDSVFKYVDKDSVSHLYRLKTYDKSILVYDIPEILSNKYYFPIAYYVEELPPELERPLLHNYDYDTDFYSYDMPLLPCAVVLDAEDYLNCELLSGFTYSANLAYVDDSDNSWRFDLEIYRESYTFETDNLSTSMLFLDSETKKYFVRTYHYFFSSKSGLIALTDLVEQPQSSLGYRQFSKDIGSGQCFGQALMYIELTQEELDLLTPEELLTLRNGNLKLICTFDLPRYGYPICEAMGTYNLEACACEGMNYCWDKLWYDCEECNPDTGEITDTCTDGEHCTVYGCWETTLWSACACGLNRPVTSFPVFKIGFKEINCMEIPFTKYRLTDAGYIQGFMDLTNIHNVFKGAWVTLLSTLDIFYKYSYYYRDTSELRTVNPMAFIYMYYLGVDFSYNAANAAAWTNTMRPYLTLDDDIQTIEVSLSEIQAIIPWFSQIILDWSGSCNYQKGNLAIEREGERHIQYLFRSYALRRLNHVNLGSLLFGAGNTWGYQETYYNYCEIVKYLGSPLAVVNGIANGVIPKSGELTI